MKEQTNIEAAIEIIGQLVYDSLPEEDSQNDEIRSIINNLLNCAESGYVLVHWPESQDYMEEDWFEEEAILKLNESSAYFIPIKRII